MRSTLRSAIVPSEHKSGSAPRCRKSSAHHDLGASSVRCSIVYCRQNILELPITRKIACLIQMSTQYIRECAAMASSLCNTKHILRRSTKHACTTKNICLTRGSNDDWGHSTMSHPIYCCCNGPVRSLDLTLHH